ncbi:MAG: low specificity L-threonine aldolase, partial [Clostridia bacterium]|nr:low specificity L-threonine aldolase [Clostridia bacterium]
MLSFECDYNRGAHPKIMERLLSTNLEAHPGYGADVYCTAAKEKIKAACKCPHADVHFLVGGTQTNSVIISSMLHDTEGVIAATTGHVNV